MSECERRGDRADGSSCRCASQYRDPHSLANTVTHIRSGPNAGGRAARAVPRRCASQRRDADRRQASRGALGPGVVLVATRELWPKALPRTPQNWPAAHGQLRVRTHTDGRLRGAAAAARPTAARARLVAGPRIAAPARPPDARARARAAPGGAAVQLGSPAPKRRPCRRNRIGISIIVIVIIERERDRAAHGARVGSRRAHKRQSKRAQHLGQPWNQHRRHSPAALLATPRVTTARRHHKRLSESIRNKESCSRNQHKRTVHLQQPRNHDRRLHTASILHDNPNRHHNLSSLSSQQSSHHHD